MAAKQILIIDDEERIREVVQTCLEIFQGWQVSLAESGAEGLAKAATHPPDAILLDVSMPDVDGIRTLDQLQSHPTTQRIPVILLTAKVQPDDRARFAELSIAGVITKPFDPVTLASQISAILGWN
ncbi:MAG: response regulator [Leptolyngbyaceae cyanobacterium SL_7_1]|nr:response regulator [Leptolyngbyaceae cyanobacterium SL_7_1]